MNLLNFLLAFGILLVIVAGAVVRLLYLRRQRRNADHSMASTGTTPPAFPLQVQQSPSIEPPTPDAPQLNGDNGDEELPPIHVYTTYYKFGLVVYLIIVLAGLATGTALLLGTSLGAAGFWILATTCVHIIMSIYSRAVNQVGHIEFYGMPVLEMKRTGLYLAPWGLFQVYLYDASLLERERPGNPDEIDWGDEKEPLKEGKVRPMRFQTGAPDKALDEKYKNDPFNAQYIIAMSALFVYVIHDSLAFRRSLRTVEDADEALFDIISASLLELVASYKGAAHFRDNIKELNDAIDGRMREKTRGWGIKMVRAGMTQVNYGHETSDAIAKVVRANVEATATITAAEANKKKLQLDGEGRGAAERAVIEGRAKGLAALKALGVSPDLAVNAETMRIVGGNANNNLIFGANGLQELVTLNATIGKSERIKPNAGAATPVVTTDPDTKS